MIKKSDLTAREQEVGRLVSLGCDNEQIGDILGIANSTADNHRSRIMGKLGTDKAVLLSRLMIKMRISSMKDKLTLSEKRKSGRRKDGWN